MKRYRRPDDVVPPRLDLQRSHIGLVLAIAGVSLAVLAVLSLTLLPRLLVDHDAYRDSRTGQIDRIKLETAKNELSRTMLQGVAALGLGATAIVTWWRIRLSEFEAGTSAQGQLAERFSRALEHLASESAVVRIGGVYALERIAEQSTWDREPIIRILLGFATERSRDLRASLNPASLGDIEAAILAVSRSGLGSAVDRLNLAKLYLPNVDLSWSLTLEWANLAEATFTGARLAGANLPFADLTRAELQDADLANVTMPRCNLTEASADRIHVLDADMRELHASDAQLKDSYFGDVILYSSKFDRANLEGAKFFGVDLSDSRFDGASLRGATVGNCWISGVDFTQADLANVVWSTADGSANACDPADPPIFPAGYEPPPVDGKLWGSGPPPRDSY